MKLKPKHASPVVQSSVCTFPSKDIGLNKSNQYFQAIMKEIKVIVLAQKAQFFTFPNIYYIIYNTS